jgi:MFS family permease
VQLDADVTATGAMSVDAATATARRRARFAIAVVFLVNGFTLASWISRIPTITADLGLSSGEVGTALMSLAAGAIVAFPIAGRLIDARSSATTLLLFALIMLAALPVVGLAPHLLLLMPALLVFGAGNGGMDVSMNAQGVQVERFYGKSIMNSLHGFYSVGAFLGAAAGAAAAHLDLRPELHFLVVSAIGLAVLFRVRGWLIADAPDEREHEAAPTFALPPRSLWMLGALALCTSVGEGAMADWSGLYLHEYLGTGKGFAALGFAAFSVCMLIGRFSGDRLVERFGAPRMVRTGGLLAAIGLGIAVAINQPLVMLLGFGAIGLGLSVVYPLVFSAAGNHPTLPSGRAVAAVATVGYTGFLAGPPILGWLAEFTSLRAIMGVVVLLAALVAVLANATRTAGAHGASGVAEPVAGIEPLG